MSGQRRRTSIRSTLTVLLLLGAGLFTALVAFLLDTTIAGFTRDRYDEDLLHSARALISHVEFDEEVQAVELDYAPEFMPQFETPAGPEFFEVWLPDGSLLARSESLVESPLPNTHDFTEVPVFSNLDLGDAGRCRLLRISFIPQREDEGIAGVLNPSQHGDEAATLLLARKRGNFDQFLALIRWLIWGSLALLLVALILLVRWSLARGLRPLADIGEQVKAVDPRVLETRIHPAEDTAELAPIVDQLNALLARLESAVERERRFTSDVAHELRTPIAELRTLAEVGMIDPEDRDSITGFFNDVHEITLEMQNLIIQLLDLSRCDSGTQKVVTETVDLVEALAKAWQRADAVVERRTLNREVHAPTVAPIRTDPLMLTQILRNLVDNAAAYAPEQSTVHVEIDIQPATTRLVLRNPAPDLNAADLPHLADRFWRKDLARTGGKNAGLGLALVHSFAELLEMEFTQELVDGGLQTTLTFPTVPLN
jgi:two-component system sensor histidine kinase QseC